MKTRAAIILILLLSPSLLFAAGYQTVGTDVQAMGQGDTGIATPNAPGNAYRNPAAAVVSPGLRGSLGVIGAYSRLRAEGGEQNTSTLPSPSAPPNLHLSFANDHIGAGGSLSVPFGTSSKWPLDWEQRFLIQQSSLTSLRTTLFVAAKWGPLSVAAGPMLDRTSLSLKRAIDFIDEEGGVTIDTHTLGYGGHAALYLQLTPKLSIGAAWHSSVSMELKGEAEFEVPPEFYSRAASGSVVVPLTLPAQGRLGLRWVPVSSVELSIEVEGTQWAVVENFVVDFDDEDVSDLSKPRQWTSTITPRVGISFAPLQTLTLRGGLYFDPSPVPPDTTGPDTPDSARVGLALGCGVQATSSLQWNLGYQYVHFTGSTTPSTAPVPLTFQGNAHLLGVSISMSL